LPASQEAADEEDQIIFQDNSFLTEEAYNQEPGVVQHTFNFVRGWDESGGHSRTFHFLFTQEWPIGSQMHQFSYQIPASRFSERPDGDPSFEGEGIGDVQLNYRLQVLGGDGELLWFSPRLSLILPTGDQSEGLGNDEVGYQINLPLSREFERGTVHFNAGLTVIPDAEAVVEDPTVPVHGQTLNGYNLGAMGSTSSNRTFT
jgi:hypothetical protein